MSRAACGQPVDLVGPHPVFVFRPKKLPDVRRHDSEFIDPVENVYGKVQAVDVV